MEAFKKLVTTSTALQDPARTTSFLFCYDTRVSKDTFLGWLDYTLDELKKADNSLEIQPWNLPDYVFCLKKGAMHERKAHPEGTQYYKIHSQGDDPSKVQQVIIQRLIQCITDGCGRLRGLQDIKLQKD